jgi:DNA-binding NarL/FixJ family response regulator
VVETGMTWPRRPASLAEHAASPIRVFLVDDSAEFLESATRFLATDSALMTVGYAYSGVEALEQIGLLHPDLVLVDLIMPEMGGLEVTSLVKSRPNAPRVIILTLYGISEYTAISEAAHADGWLAKSEFGTRLLPMIHDLFAQPNV